jgi:hypothetical protein
MLLVLSSWLLADGQELRANGQNLLFAALPRQDNPGKFVAFLLLSSTAISISTGNQHAEGLAGGQPGL